MRRSSALLFSLAVTLLVGGALGLASSSAATRSQRIIICPVSAQAPPPIDCCGPPIVRVSLGLPLVDCCPTNAPLCAQTLTISSKPNPSTADHRVVITGQLFGAPTVGVPVELWQQLPGQTRFSQVAHATTDASGMYTITRDARQVQTDRQWYVTAGTMRSTTITQQVQAIVTLAATAGPRGSTIFAGHVSPSHKGELIGLQRHSAHGWRTIARARLTRASNFRLRHRLGRGAAVLRALLPADRMNALSVSAPLSVHSR